MRLSSIGACLALAAAATLPFQPWAKYRVSPWAFEVRAESDQSGLVQLYYDLGGGESEEASVARPIVAGRPCLLRFSLPYGTLRTLRFDPLDRDARMTFSDARIVDGSGRTMASISPQQFRARQQIESVDVRNGKLNVVTAPGGTDPQMAVALAGPIVIERDSAWVRIGEVFAALLAVLLAFEWAGRSRALRLGERAAELLRLARGSPGLAVAAAALLGTVVANYPVVFAGKGIVTPNLGVALLYGQNPWLPGAASADVGRANGTDVAALLWHHLPLSAMERRALFDEGELPLWNRYDSAGSPLLGQGQSCLGDPLQLLPILAGGAAWAWELKFLLAKWAFACGMGLCVWRCFRSLPAALAIAASASLIGFFVYRICHPAVFSLCYSPWILYCWLGCVGSNSARGAVLWLVALIGANWVEMCSGTAKEAYVLMFSINFAGACVLLACERPVWTRARLLLGAVLAGGIFAMVGAPIWYTFLRALKESYTSYNAPLAFQLQPGLFLGLFDEAFYRPFQEKLWVINPSANVFVLLGLLWALVRWRSVASNRRALGLFLSSLPALALVFGVISPSFVTRVPILGNIQHIDNTLSCALIVIFGVLAGVGWKEAWERLGSADGRREAVAVVALLLLVFGAYLGTAQAIVRSGYWQNTWGNLIRLPAFIHGYGWSLMAASALLLWVLHLVRRRGSLTPATLVLAILALGALHWREALQVGTGFAEYVVKPTRRVDLMAPSQTIEAIQAQRDAPFRTLGFHNDLLPGWSIVYGLEGISGPDALVNPFYREFMDTAGVPRVWDWRYIVETSDVARLKPVLDALNVRFYVGYHQGRRPDDRLLKPFLAADMDAFESGSAWPRAFFTDSVAVYQDAAQFVSWLKAGDGRPFAAVQHGDWIGLSPAPRVSGDLGTRRIEPASDYRLTTNTTSFTVNATGPGFIVLSEAYERDNFHLTINGERAQYFRVNHAFKGIYVDRAGVYQVTYEYYPRGFLRSLELFGAGLGVMAVAVLGAVYLPRRGAPAPA